MATTTVHAGLAGKTCTKCGGAVQVGQQIDYRMHTDRGVWHRACPAKVAPVAVPVAPERAALVARYGEEQVTRAFGPADARGPESLLGGCGEPDIDS